VNAKTEDVVARVMEIAPGGVSHALDSSGATSSWATAAGALRSTGKFGVVAPPDGDPMCGNPHAFLSKAICVQFILAGSAVPKVFIPKLIEWYKQGRYPVDRLITRYDFADINDAVSAAEGGQAVKPVLLMP
jgi:Zn-dependent alcohol dehydrogenase